MSWNNPMDLIDFAALAALYACLCRRWKTAGRGTLLVRSLFYLYIVMVLYVTLMPVLAALPFLFDHPYRPMNMTPFNDLIRHYGGAGVQIVLNAFMMMPFGFLLPASRSRKFLCTVLCTFLFSLGIELLQPLLSTARSSDITDLICNTAGGALGFLVWIPFRGRVRALVARLNGAPDRTY